MLGNVGRKNLLAILGSNQHPMRSEYFHFQCVSELMSEHVRPREILVFCTVTQSTDLHDLLKVHGLHEGMKLFSLESYFHERSD